MRILGISAYYHDAAAVLLDDGVPVAAAQEERFTRIKHDASFPRHAIDYCLNEASSTVNECDYVVFYEKPFLKFERILTSIVATAPRNYRQYMKAMPVWLKEKMWLPSILRKELGFRGPLLFATHHRAHAASAYFASGFDESAILTVDGVGEWETTTIGRAKGNEVVLTESIHFPHSIGLLYSAFTAYLGFKVNSGEYKVMGLAPYGKPVYSRVILDSLLHLGDGGAFWMDQRFFDYSHGMRMVNGRFEELFGRPSRLPESDLDQFHMDVAASIQDVTNTVMVRLAEHALERAGSRNLCIAGGVALNCVANEEILRRTGVDRLFIQPAAGDAGGALGAALDIQYGVLNLPRTWTQRTVAYGPSFSDDEIGALLVSAGIDAVPRERQELLRTVVESIERQEVVGWFQGRMEWGPRSLGFRSILADARNPENQKRVNMKVKFRESFRPFAPAVPEELFDEWFEGPKDPFMLVTSRARHGRSVLPATTHVDNSARVQCVSRAENPLFHALLMEMYRRSGCAVVINTSFNVRGEPIVCTPSDALKCFFNTEIDSLALGSYFLRKRDLPTLSGKPFGTLIPTID